MQQTGDMLDVVVDTEVLLDLAVDVAPDSRRSSPRAQVALRLGLLENGVQLRQLFGGPAGRADRLAGLCSGTIASIVGVIDPL